MSNALLRVTRLRHRIDGLNEIRCIFHKIYISVRNTSKRSVLNGLQTIALRQLNAYCPSFVCIVRNGRKSGEGSSGCLYSLDYIYWVPSQATNSPLSLSLPFCFPFFSGLVRYKDTHFYKSILSLTTFKMPSFDGSSLNSLHVHTHAVSFLLSASFQNHNCTFQ